MDKEKSLEQFKKNINLMFENNDKEIYLYKDDALKIEYYIYSLEQQCKKQKEVIDDCKEDISNLLDIINKNCNELKCTSDEWLVIQKYQDKEVSE